MAYQTQYLTIILDRDLLPEFPSYILSYFDESPESFFNLFFNLYLIEDQEIVKASLIDILSQFSNGSTDGTDTLTFGKVVEQIYQVYCDFCQSFNRSLCSLKDVDAYQNTIVIEDVECDYRPLETLNLNVVYTRIFPSIAH